jgi:hypothetical protein
MRSQQHPSHVGHEWQVKTRALVPFSSPLEVRLEKHVIKSYSR